MRVFLIVSATVMGLTVGSNQSAAQVVDISGTAKQAATNRGTVKNRGIANVRGALKGSGSSVSISAVGAANDAIVGGDQYWLKRCRPAGDEQHLGDSQAVRRKFGEW